MSWLWVIPEVFCSLLFGSNLKMLATIYLSDKWNSHWYAQHYQTHFHRLRRKRINILEIGIGGYDNPESGGSSLRMWRTYFPNGRVYGVDIYDKSPHNGRRIKTFKGSQIDPDFLDSVVRSIGKIRISSSMTAAMRMNMFYSLSNIYFLIWPTAVSTQLRTRRPPTGQSSGATLTSGMT